VKRPLAIVLLVLATVGCPGDKKPKLTIQTVPITRRDIIVDASANGTVEPINVVEVKSKASGLITQMVVETGSLVKPGDLLVQVDTRDVKNSYDQAAADLKASESSLSIAEAQKKRNDDLFKSRIITATEHEQSELQYANASASVVRARANLDLAQQRLDDATVRAPIAGTIIEKTVSLGQVITSATSAVGGGTTLLKMADLNKVRVRALMSENDVGNIRAGQSATVTFDAYPDRPFRGSVEKIEPQAVIQQSVTMFPVLVALSNEGGLLKPGMNGDASVLIDQRSGVLAVPNDAIRTVREAAAAATALGLNVDSVQAQIKAQGASMGGGFGGGAGGAGRRGQRGGQGNAGQGNGGNGQVSRGDVDLAAQGDQQQGRRGQRGPQIEVSDKDCAAVKTAFEKHKDAQPKLDALREKARNQEIDFNQMREESAKIYAAVGVDARVAGACRMKERIASGEMGGGRQGAGQSAGGQGGNNQRGRGGADAGVSTPVQAGEFPTPTRARPGLIFIAEKGTYTPRIVRLGMSDFDYTEVVSGAKEGEQVALLAAATMQMKRQEQNDKMRSMTGSPLTGGQGQRGGPGGGAPRGGGGPPR
jgi:HlyD family secretion protein